MTTNYLNPNQVNIERTITNGLGFCPVDIMHGHNSNQIGLDAKLAQMEKIVSGDHGPRRIMWEEEHDNGYSPVDSYLTEN